MIKFSQQNNLISIHTPLGTDTLLLTKFSGEEAISELFKFNLEMHSSKNNITFEDIIGKNVTISIVQANKKFRYFNGIINRFSQDSVGIYSDGIKLSTYSASMVPWLWLLKDSTNSRIFQDLTIPEIIESIFEEKKLQDYKFALNESYQKREYCVQYRETDFQFVSRLLEEEGIFYFFEHK